MLLFFGISWWVKGKGLVDVKVQKEKDRLTTAEAEQITNNLILAISSTDNPSQLIRDIEKTIRSK